MSVQIDYNDARYSQAAGRGPWGHDNGEPEGSRGDGHLMPLGSRCLTVSTS